MNNKRALACILLCLWTGRIYCATPPTSTVRELVAVLEWEVLWNQTPDGFRIPPGPVSFAMQRTANSVSYCSHELRACEKYETYDFRPWKEISRQKCEGKQSDENCLYSFVGGAGRGPKAGSTEFKLGTGGLSGIPQGTSGIISTGHITLRPQHLIEDQYRNLHPRKLNSLEHWLKATGLTTAGYTSITIACFTPTDPDILLYGQRKSNGPILISVFWDREIGQWQVAGLLEGDQNRKRLETFSKLLNAIPCATDRFQ